MPTVNLSCFFSSITSPCHRTLSITIKPSLSIKFSDQTEIKAKQDISIGFSENQSHWFDTNDFSI